MFKVCKCCHVEKPFSDFYLDRSKPDGHNRMCKPCDRTRAAKWAADNRERSNAIKKRYVENNPDKRKQSSYGWFLRCKKSSRVVLGEAVTRRLALANYRAKKFNATPQWLSKEDRQLIREVYTFAKLREQAKGGKWHVDHIVPLRGDFVCGLHVPWNLQVLPAKANRLKSNKLIEGEQHA